MGEIATPAIANLGRLPSAIIVDGSAIAMLLAIVTVRPIVAVAPDGTASPGSNIKTVVAVGGVTVLVSVVPPELIVSVADENRAGSLKVNVTELRV